MGRGYCISHNYLHWYQEIPWDKRINKTCRELGKAKAWLASNGQIKKEYKKQYLETLTNIRR